MTEKRFTLQMDSEWWVVGDNTVKVNELGYREDLTGEDKYRGLEQDLTEQEVVDLLNEQNQQIKELRELLDIGKTNSKSILDMLNQQQNQIKELKRMLQLVSEAETVRNENSVKEIVRNTLFGLDSVAGESANAYNDYTILNKFFKEYYKEYWDNDKFE